MQLSCCVAPSMEWEQCWANILHRYLECQDKTHSVGICKFLALFSKYKFSFTLLKNKISNNLFIVYTVIYNWIMATIFSTPLHCNYLILHRVGVLVFNFNKSYLRWKTNAALHNGQFVLAVTRSCIARVRERTSPYIPSILCGWSIIFRYFLNSLQVLLWSWRKALQKILY
jgi:hypothetical protein